MSSFGIQAECSLHFSVCDLVAFSEAETSYHSLNCLVFRLLFTKVFVLTEACGSNLSAFVLFLFTELATIQAVCLIMWNSLQWQSSLLLLQSGHTCLQLHGYFTCLITSFFLDESKSWTRCKIHSDVVRSKTFQMMTLWLAVIVILEKSIYVGCDPGSWASKITGVPQPIQFPGEPGGPWAPPSGA